MPNNSVNGLVNLTIQFQDTSLPGLGTQSPVFSRNISFVFPGNDFAVQRVTATASYLIPHSGSGFSGVMYVRNVSQGQNIGLQLGSSPGATALIPLFAGSFIFFASPNNVQLQWPFILNITAYAGSTFPIDFEYALLAVTNP